MTNHETGALPFDGPNPDIVAWCEQTASSLAARGIGNGDWLTHSRDEMYDRLDRIVGQTPIEPVPELPGVYSKLEYRNPSGSHYDRAYLDTLRIFEHRGLIQPGDELRDITSGSAGIALALLGNLLGYKVRICVPDELPASRIYPIEFFGAELVNTGPGYIQATSNFQADEIRALKASPDWNVKRAEDRSIRAFFFQNKTTGERLCYVNHSENNISPDAHKILAREMVMQMVEPPEALFLGQGNWTTTSGIVPVVRKSWPDTVIFGVAPAEYSNINNFGLVVPGLTMPLRFRDQSLLDHEFFVSDSDREAMRARINTNRDPVNRVGNSTLLLYAAAQQLTSKGPKLTIAYDQEMRY